MKKQEEIIKNNEYVVIKFFAIWCGPCKMYAPIFTKAVDKINGKINDKDVKFLEIDIDELPELATKYEVFSIPTTLILKNGKVIATKKGFLPHEDNVIDFLKENIA